MRSVEDHRPGASPEHPDLRDYVSWHAAYHDPEPESTESVLEAC